MNQEHIKKVETMEKAMSDAPERIWIDAWGGNWSGVAGGTQEHEYRRADLPPKVKPLEWDKHPDAEYFPEHNEHYGGGQDNMAGVSEYAIFPHPCAIGMFVLDVMGNRCDDDFASVEAAKAAAQADYEHRILSALEGYSPRNPA